MQLHDTHVIHATWVTGGVYAIINSQLLAKQRGILPFSQLKQVFRAKQDDQNKYPADKYVYLIELMLKFDLCYRLDGSSILIPDLLDVQEPELESLSEHALHFVFEYQYLPKLKTLAIVRADEKAKRIYVTVDGEQKRDYFAVIRKAISDINQSFEKLSVIELVPLPDAGEVLIEYRELIGHELAKRNEIFVGRMGRAYSVQLLLNGIEAAETRQLHAQTIVNVQGTYISQSSQQAPVSIVVDQSGNGVTMGYQPQLWEKIVSYSTAVGFIVAIVFLLIRNQPIADPNLAVILRIALSLMVAILGASVPGLLSVDLTSKRGIAIRSTGALALFVISFLMTPKVLSHH